MSWAEVKKINGNMSESLDALINRVPARKMKTVYQSITAARSTITTNQTIVDVKGAGVLRRILINGNIRATGQTNLYVHPGSLKIDDVQKYTWNGSQAGGYFGGAYINYQGDITAWTGAGNQSTADSPFCSSNAAYGGWPNIYAVELNWRFINGFTIALTALATPSTSGTGTSVFYLLYDLEVGEK